MKAVSKRYNLYHDLGYWFLGSLVLVLLGFYKSYFIVLLEPQKAILHFHFLLMMIWIALLITQPFLIKYKKLSIHRLAGKLSYLIVPLLAFTTFMLIRQVYYTSIADLSASKVGNTLKYSQKEVYQQAAYFIALPFVYLLWLMIFYALAIINKKHSPTHARYMLAAGLTITGPTVDRILFSLLNINVFPLGIPLETLSYILIDVILVLLLWKDYREKRKLKTLCVCLGIYLALQVIYFTCSDTEGWGSIIAFLM